ncbi:bifunctional 3-(3-hydroxy-phenyl)propionate/3-hydroxycinnamic acid hydroxylase [Nocardioides gilvus]|uniref:bifunctional 3-(3-hydroxy-phenyl)propionate/3-hydroxycinnamic acid hydroxylase n=1 Tax=Nocardioides gilvus TaxID=1735589 RepID=UPI000D743D7C|nr:bifunctional 3-(3-hydroxy-phenyl)propionate/3-hydroxycinnamic acid hydroxylase [Nocardioides gilvus]
MTSPHTTDVLILGAGPTGLTLANLLGQQGVRTLLVEALDDLIDYPRAVGIDDEALRVMQSIGLVDKVLPHTVPDQRVRIVNQDMKVIAEINPTTREFGWPRRNGFVQPLVDRVLLDGLARWDSVTVRMGAEAVDLVQTADEATVTVRTAQGTETITARYVVAAEGGRSFARMHLGIAFEGETRKQRGLVIDVADDPLGTPHAVFGGDPSRAYATLALPHGIRRWEFMLHEDEGDELVESDAFVHGLLADHVPDPAGLNIIRRRVYMHHARLAERFREGRVLLAGDAAHVMPVVAGQGWNSCIRDAVNLGWKLTAVVRGDADDSLLDTYAEERRDHVRAMVELSVNMANVVTNRSKLRSAARDAAAAVVDRLPKLKAYVSAQGFKPMPRYERGAIVPVVIPSSKSVPVPEGYKPGVGTLFPQPRVTAPSGGEALLDDVTGAGWRVVVWNNDPSRLVSKETRETLERLGGRLVRVVPSVQAEWATAEVDEDVVVVGDPVGVLKTWFHGRPFSAVVVRPDHVIAAECLAQELDGVLGQVFAAARVSEASSTKYTK